MDFETLEKNISGLVDFIRPVAGLVSDFYHAMVARIPIAETSFNVLKALLIIGIVAALFKKLASD